MMHIGKKLYRSVAVLCALVLSLGFVFSDCMVARASTDSVDVQLPKLMDIALTAQGVVASPAVLDSVSDALVAKVQDGLDAVYNAMVSAGETTWNNVSSYISECVDDYSIQKILNAYIESVKDYGFMLPVVTAVDVATALSPNEHGGSGRERGKTYTLDEEFIDTINDVFQIWWTENEDYFIWRVPAFSEIDSRYMSSADYTFADNFFEAIAETNKVYFVQTQHKKFLSNQSFSNQLVLGVVENKDFYFYTDTTYLPNDSARVYPYYDGIAQGFIYYGVYDDSGNFVVDLDSFIEDGLSITELDVYEDYDASSELFYEYSSGTVAPDEYGSYCWIFRGIVGRNAFNIRLFKDDESADDFVVDDQTVYFTPNYNPDVPKTVTYTGDYYIDNAVIYNYNIVQETIDNSSTIDNSIVNEIVDNSVTEIVNNYTNTEPEATATPEPLVTMPPDLGDTDKDGDGEVSLTEFFQGIKDLIAWLLNTLGQIASLIADLGNGILSILNTFTGLFSGFSGLLGVMFSFIPEQLLDALTAGMSAVVLIALYNKFLRGKD